MANEHVCTHTDDIYNFTYEYCSSVPYCPAGEQMCYDYSVNFTMGTPFCSDASSPCPVICPPGESVCTETTGMGQYEYCSASPCPPTCDTHEILCWDYSGNSPGIPYCTDQLTCPISCMANEHVCTHTDDIYNFTYEYCSSV